MKRLAEITGAAYYPGITWPKCSTGRRPRGCSSMIELSAAGGGPAAVGRRHRRAAPGSAMGRHRR